MKGHRVSLGLPVYNGQRYLAGAIRAVLAQTFSDFELIICDNASTDATEQICREFAERDPRVRYHRNPANIGAAPNFNAVFELSTGEYFKWVAHDDLHAPTYLARAVEVLDRDRGVVLCHSRVGVIDEYGNALTPVPVNGQPFRLEQRHGLVARDTPQDLHEAALRDPLRALGSANPATRLEELLLRTHWCFEIFGLMRREVALRTPRHGTFYGSDKVMLSHLCLAGRFHEIEDELFLRRYHGGSSTGIRSARDREAWIGASAGKLVFPRLKCFAGYASAIRNSKIGMFQKLECYGVLARYALQFDKWRRAIAPATVSQAKQSQPQRIAPERLSAAAALPRSPVGDARPTSTLRG
jgi:hypothetical protein